MRIDTPIYEQTTRHPPIPQGTTPTSNPRFPPPPPGFAPQKPFPARLSPHPQSRSENRHPICAPSLGASSPRHDRQPPQSASTVRPPLRRQLALAPTIPHRLTHASLQRTGPPLPLPLSGWLPLPGTKLLLFKGTSLPSGNTVPTAPPNKTRADDQNRSLPWAIPITETRQRVLRPHCARRLTPDTLLGSWEKSNRFMGAPGRASL